MVFCTLRGAKQNIMLTDGIRDVQMYNTVYRRWLLSVPDMIVARHCHCSVGLNRCVYVLGGFGQD